jgi:hypothetical protein
LRRRSAGAAAAVAVAALALPGAALAGDAGSATAASGAVSATLTWDAAELGNANPHLVVTRAGATAFDGSPVTSSQGCSEGGCTYAASGERSGPLQVRDLDGDGEPEVLVDAYTGGAHCCSVTEILRFSGAAYSVSEAFWGDPGYDLTDLNADGRPEFVTFDDAFAGAFTSYAGSFFPPLVLDYDTTAQGGFRDVTRSYPALVRKNMTRALKGLRSARRRHYETRGAVAAYVADLYLLRRGREVRPYLTRARKRGDLRGLDGQSTRKYERQLLAFLHKQGYR